MVLCSVIELGCQHKPTKAPVIVIDRENCLTSDIEMFGCNSDLTHCKLIKFRHKPGCERLVVGK